MIVRLTVCTWCRRMLLDGEPPAEFGTCISCGRRIDEERSREEFLAEVPDFEAEVTR